MSYFGREDLASLFIDYFDNYKNTFAEHIKESFTASKVAFNTDTKELYEELFDMLLVKNIDTNYLEKIISNAAFNKVIFYEALFKTQSDFAKFLHSSNKTNFNHLHYLLNACEHLIALINNSQEIHSGGQVSSIKISANNAGFMIHEDFFDAFIRLAQAGEQIEFLNLYNGVPVRTFSKSLRADNDCIIAQLELTQILAMKEEGCAYIVNNKYLSNNLKANILWVNTTNMTVALNKFETQAYMHALKRKYPRVHPDRFTKISLVHADGRVATGKLFDISQGGMGVVSTEDVGFKSGDILTTDIELKSSEETIYLHLSFRLVVLIVYQNAYRYCLELEPNQKDAALIEGFAKTREAQTIDELNALIEQYRS